MSEYKREDWVAKERDGDTLYLCNTCGVHCPKIYFNWNEELTPTSKKRWLCQSCLNKLFEPELKPLTEWNENLVGRRVICITDKNPDILAKGTEVTVLSGINDPKGSRGVPGNFLKVRLPDSSGRYTWVNWFISDFALAPEQPSFEGMSKASSVAKIYEKDNAWWWEKDGYTVCARIGSNVKNPLPGISKWHSDYNVMVKKPNGSNAPGCDMCGSLSALGLSTIHIGSTSYWETLKDLAGTQTKAPYDHCNLRNFDGSDEYVNVISSKVANIINRSVNGKPMKQIYEEEVQVCEVTHSCTMKFPNGDVVEIPGPVGEGWKEEVIFDEWTERDADRNSPIITLATKGKISIKYDRGYKKVQYAVIWHELGVVMLREYENRIIQTIPTLISLTKYTREAPTATSQDEVETYRNPLPPEPPPSKFWVENHEVVWRKKDTSTVYPGADKRPPEPKGSGIWLECHAPAIKSVY